MTNLQRKSLITQLLPFADIKVTSNEIRILCDRFDTPRFIELEKENVCRKCPPDADYLVAKDGIYVQCDRLKGGEKFVPFDHIYEMPQYCAFRVRGRKLFKFVHVFPGPKNNNKKRRTDKLKPDDAPILTTILPHLILHHEEKPRPDDAPILTTVLPHLLSGAEEVNKEKKADEEIPILTAFLPHLITPHEQQGQEEMTKETAEIKEEQQEHDGDDVPILTTLLPHLESHL